MTIIYNISSLYGDTKILTFKDEQICLGKNYTARITLRTQSRLYDRQI